MKGREEETGKGSTCTWERSEGKRSAGQVQVELDVEVEMRYVMYVHTRTRMSYFRQLTFL